MNKRETGDRACFLPGYDKAIPGGYSYIAADFDGTLCEHEFPEIGEPIRETIDFIKERAALGVKIILHTCRENDEGGRRYLDEALSWCEKEGIPVDAVNENPWVPFGKRKIYADIYIDDRAVNTDEIAGRRFSLNKFTQEVHENAAAHGWWDEERSFPENIALCHSELSEALEEYRRKKPNVYFKEVNGFVVTDMNEHRGEKPEGIAVELADCIIRILDYCGRVGIDIEEILKIKHEYNKSRPYKHGGKVI